MSRSLPVLPIIVLLGAHAGGGQQPTPAGTATGDPTGGIHVLRFDPHDGSVTRAPAPPVRILGPTNLLLAPGR